MREMKEHPTVSAGCKSASKYSSHPAQSNRQRRVQTTEKSTCKGIPLAGS